MQFQAILLSLVVLVSIVVSPILNKNRNQTEITPEKTAAYIQNVGSPIPLIEKQTVPVKTEVSLKNNQTKFAAVKLPFAKTLENIGGKIKDILSRIVLVASRFVAALKDDWNRMVQSLIYLKSLIFDQLLHNFFSVKSSAPQAPEIKTAVIASAGFNFLVNGTDVPAATSTTSNTASNASSGNASPIGYSCKTEEILKTFNGETAIIRYLNNNNNVFEFHPEKRWPIASLTKLMTSVIVLEKMDLNAKIRLDESTILNEDSGGHFKAGETFRVRDLVKAMLVASSNNAAAALVQNFGEKNFIDEMQKKASELHMFETTYLEPTGLSFINQSTVGDLAKLANYIYQNHPEILQISRQKQVEIVELNTGKTRKVFNIDQFAGETGFIGGKTGYIDESGRNLLSIFQISNQPVLFVVLGTDDSFKETQNLKNFFLSCEAL